MFKRLSGIVMILALLAIISAARADGRALRSDTSPSATWWHDDGVIPTVIVENHVTDFPIITAVNNWNSAGAKFKFGTCVDQNAPCVKVYTVNWGANGYNATTSYSTWDGPPRTIVGVVTIKLNYYYGYSGPWPGYNARLQTTLHELGHSWGLTHDTSGGCMASGVDGKHAYISTYEKSKLRSLYGL